MVEISHIHVSGDSHRNAPGQELEQDSIIQRKESNGRKRKPSESGALSSEPLDKRPRVESFTVSSSNQIDKVGLSQHTFDEDDLYDIFGSEPDNDPTMVHHNPTYPSPSPSTPQSLEKRTSARPPLTTHLPIPFQTSIPTPDSDPILNKHHSDAFHTAQTLIDWYKKRALETEIRHQEEQRLSHLRIASLENSLKNSQAAEITSSARIRELEEQLKVTRACVLTTSTPSQNEVELRKQVDYYEIEVEYLGTKAESRRKERDDLVIQLKGLRHDFEVLRQKRVVTQLPDKEETPSPTYQLEECKKEVRKLSGGNEEIGDFSRQWNPNASTDKSNLLRFQILPAKTSMILKMVNPNAVCRLKWRRKSLSSSTA
ncbi:hypothetical protein TREMEDRAFT_65362 [Tremella mesenterica DSM 1558]|uniref:uncharacterized protein n=1 Tax=Tremella mesenterica (strain ATCC 24925 / CBS 8224 / DSM 1558 / NBRC 9311 / NRRL Y-6157 / RJB 2259-6 / UBC 559-6) TaxID=578456 RepID=UPI00032BEB1D|nr:uncharacterized protein TREMEDRAFT_65362 [Tremella mesenterica DSM 1558]EIW66500.1 hypothetical protein TREMEDRAFT_65362 [Tremella mesenterica DSM 1558]